MGSLGAILKHPDELIPLLKLKLAARRAEKSIRLEPHWAFCYTILNKVARSFALVIRLLRPELRDVICIFYLVLRALDTVGGRDHEKVLMDGFHHVTYAFSEFGRDYQRAIEYVTVRMGAGMAKFICKEIETSDDYDEYCHYAAGLVGIGLSKVFHAANLEELASDALCNSVGLFLQKTNITRDYLEDINEIPKSRMFWPRDVWSKYVNKLEGLKCEENSGKAVECLNEMVTGALLHAEDSLQYMSNLRDSSILRFYAMTQIMAMATLSLCYNNVKVFRGTMKVRRGLTAKIIDRTKSMSDVYSAFFDFSNMLKSKVDKNDPNATKTLSVIEGILKVCRDSGTLNNRRSSIIDDQSKPNLSALISMLIIALSVMISYWLSDRCNATLCKYIVSLIN